MNKEDDEDIKEFLLSIAEWIKDCIAVILLNSIVAMIIFGVVILIVSFLVWQSPIHIVKSVLNPSSYLFCIRAFIIGLLLSVIPTKSVYTLVFKNEN